MNLNAAYVYILSNKNRTVLYIGITNDLERRISEHRNVLCSSFTKKYNVHDLIYYEIHNDIMQAIKREKQLKEWKRSWKEDLIRTMNPEMLDLAIDWKSDFKKQVQTFMRSRVVAWDDVTKKAYRGCVTEKTAHI